LRALSLTKKREATTENGFRHTNVTIGFGTLHAPSRFYAKSHLAHFMLPSRFYAKSVESIVFRFGVPNLKNYRRP